jgi:hypothetical protein
MHVFLFLPTPLACSALIVVGLCACGKKQLATTHDSPAPSGTQEIADPAMPSDNWMKMETLAPDKWTPIEGAADIEWDEENHVLRIGFGNDLNGVRWTGPAPVTPYAVELEARRMSGSDFFCGLTFPVRSGKEHVSFIVGGWGGNLVGISSIDGMDASENSTASQQEFEDQKWYRIRVEVRQEHIQAWIDDKQVVDAFTEEQKLSLRPGPIEDCAPFGLATWTTKAEVRGVRWRKLEK